jgi:hypothetical protein
VNYFLNKEIIKMATGCDFCTKSVKYPTLHCYSCYINMCDTCYNLTCGGNCCFLARNGAYHTTSHPPMMFLDSEEKETLHNYHLRAKSYISVNIDENVRTTLNICLADTRIISYVAKLISNEKKPAMMRIKHENVDVFTYKHSPEDSQLLNKEDIKSVILDKEINITCRRSDFTILITELLESLDYPESIVKNIILDLLASCSYFKMITFRCIRSPYNVTSSHPFNHIKGALIIWSGDLQEQEVHNEEETISRLRNMTKLLKEDIKSKYNGKDYSMFVTSHYFTPSIINV